MIRSLLILALALSQAACLSSRSIRFSNDDTLLGVEEREDGTQVTWRLNASRSGIPTVERTVRETRQRAWLGVVSTPIGKLRADRYGLEPWDGVRLESVVDNSPAEAAGLLSGDIVTALDDVGITSPEQLSQVIEQRLQPGREAMIRALRFEGNPLTRRPIDVSITPGGKDVVDQSTDAVQLESSVVVKSLTGLYAASIPAELASEAIGSPSGAVFVAGVLPGSPAYLAGLRAGDRVVEVDGEAVDSLDSLTAAVLGRADELGLSVNTDERRDLTAARRTEGPIALTVDGPLGRHVSELDVSDELAERGEIDIPIVFECDSDISSTRWSLLDFIFQFGANYRGYYLDSETREPARSTFFSMLPFGFFEVERNPRRSRYCVLWFIEWEVDR